MISSGIKAVLVKVAAMGKQPKQFSLFFYWMLSLQNIETQYVRAQAHHSLREEAYWCLGLLFAVCFCILQHNIPVAWHYFSLPRCKMGTGKLFGQQHAIQHFFKDQLQLFFSKCQTVYHAMLIIKIARHGTEKGSILFNNFYQDKTWDQKSDHSILASGHWAWLDWYNAL